MEHSLSLPAIHASSSAPGSVAAGASVGSSADWGGFRASLPEFPAAPYLDVMTINTAQFPVTIDGGRNQEPHSRLLVEPISVPNLSHTGVDTTFKPRKAPLFNSNGTKNPNMREVIRTEFRHKVPVTDPAAADVATQDMLLASIRASVKKQLKQERKMKKAVAARAQTSPSPDSDSRSPGRGLGPHRSTTSSSAPSVTARSVESRVSAVSHRTRSTVTLEAVRLSRSQTNETADRDKDVRALLRSLAVNNEKMERALTRA